MNKLPIYLLNNGVKIVLDYVGSVQTAAVGFFFEGGSQRDGKNLGLAHFCEHILFKNQLDKNGNDLTDYFDKKGIQVNAFTTKQLTCFNFRGLSKDADFVLKSFKRVLSKQYLDDQIINAEKQVVIREIAEGESSMNAYFDNLLLDTAYKNQVLGNDVCGTKKTVENLSKNDILDFIKNNYVPSNLVICISGNFNKNKILNLISDLYGDMKNAKRNAAEKFKYTGGEKLVKDDGERSYFYVGYDAPSYKNIKDVYTAKLLKIALTGNLNSILYKEFREKKGLVYSIKNNYFYYTDTGIFSLFFPVAKGKIEEVEKLLFDILKSFQGRITAEDLKDVKTIIKVGISVEMEDMQARVLRSGYQVSFYHNLYSVKEIMDLIDSISVNDIEKLAKKMFASKTTIIKFG